MSIGRVKPSGWSANAKLLSPEATQLDINIARALDKTVSGDTLAGRIATSSGAGIDYGNGASETHGSGSTETHTAGSSDSYQTGSTLDHATGSAETHASGSTDTYASGATLTAAVGAVVSFSGTTTCSSTLNANNATPITVPATSQVRTVSATPYFAATDYSPLLGALSYGWITLLNTAVQLHIPVQFDNGNAQTLTAIGIHFSGAAAGSLPAAMPTITLYASPVGTGASGTQFVVATATDASAGLGAFNGEHLIAATGLLHTIDTINNLYHLVVTAGSGGGSTTGSVVYGCRYTISRTSILE